jgi:hypothetical protein
VTVVHCIGKAFGIFVAHLLWIVAYIARFVLSTVVFFCFPSLCFFFFFSISSSELLLRSLLCIDRAFAMFIAHLLWIVTHIARFGDSE